MEYLDKFSDISDISEMNKPINLNIRVGGNLGDYIAQKVSANGDYDNYSEYVRDLIRKDKEAYEKRVFDMKKAELQKAFAASDSEYVPLSASDIIMRNKA